MCISYVLVFTKDNTFLPMSWPSLSDDEMQLVDATISSLRLIQKCRKVEDVKQNLRVETVITLCNRVESFFNADNSLLKLNAPINIVGDIHGQFLDLLRYFEVGGFPPDSQYLFLGDYIDRGKMGMECTMLLFCFKLRYPDRFFMLRGNHECSQISRMYGFHDECKSKYDIACWTAVNNAFKYLPLAAIVNDRIFATHGGLSPDLTSLDQIMNIQRPTDVPVDGLLCDLLWADPTADAENWDISDRGVSYLFGSQVLDTFMKINGFDLFVRAHQVVENGYEFFPKDSRQLVTVFSAVNYCGQFDNAGAMLLVDEDLICSFHIIRPSPPSSHTFQDTEGEFDRPKTPLHD